MAWAIVPSTAPRTADTTAASAAAKLINMARRSSVAKALIHETVAAPIAAFASVARKNTTLWTHSCSLSGITSLARQTSAAALLIVPLITSMPRTPHLLKTRRSSTNRVGGLSAPDVVGPTIVAAAHAAAMAAAPSHSTSMKQMTGCRTDGTRSARGRRRRSA